ncbi:divergent polysaccharide deacetylase family protein [bacterium]|nr:divergent polysaccharide deacetylase family protein [bacterium]
MKEPAKIIPVDYPAAEILKSAVDDVCLDFDIIPSKSINIRNRKEEWKIKVPQDLPVVNFHLALKERINRIPAKIINATSDPVSGRVRVNVGYKDSAYFDVLLIPMDSVKRNRGRIALIIDDFGDRWDSFTRSFADLGIHLTVSVLPGRKKSSDVARGMNKLNCEVILHLPMEPISEKFPKDGLIIFDDMKRFDILNIIQRSLDDVPNAKGVNNHMGSKVTQNSRVMEIILRDLKKRGLYFVDSRTTAKTVAYQIARSINIPCTKRDIFIDYEKDGDTIRKQLWNLARKSEKRGFAIGIGHSRPLTLKILQQEVGKIQAKGYRFVFVSDVLH